MKKYFTRNEKGFSLIEILVTVAIIAILSVIAVAVYTNVQKSARDGKRRSEVDAISKAMEVNKSATGPYSQLTELQFGGGFYPGRTATSTTATDPSGFPYCILGNTTGAAIADAAVAGWAGGGTPACPAGYSIVGNGTPVANSTAWKVCTLLETTPATVFCKNNNQ